MYMRPQTKRPTTDIKTMGVAGLPIWLILTVLSGHINQSTCLSTFEDTFKVVYSDTPLLVSSRKEITKMLEEGQPPLTAMEYGQKITGWHPSGFESANTASHRNTGSNQAAAIQSDLEDKILPHLYRLRYPGLGPGFTRDAQEKYLELMKTLSENLLFDHPEIEKTTTLKSSPSLNPPNQGATNFNAGQGQHLSKIFNDFDEIHQLLASAKSHTTSHGPKKTIYSLIFGLSDVLTRYLVVLERYRLIDSEPLSEFLNAENHWMVIFNHVFGKIPSAGDPAGMQLMYDFRDSLQHSGVTEEIHGLLHLIQEKNWKKMEQLYLATQITLYDGSNQMWNRVKKLFFETVVNFHPSPNSIDNHNVNFAMLELAADTNTIKHSNPSEDWESIGLRMHRTKNLKLTLSMIHYFIQFLAENNGAQWIKNFKNQSFYPTLRAIDMQAKLLHEVLKISYYKYGELIQVMGTQEQILEHLLPTYLTGKNSIGVGDRLKQTLEAVSQGYSSHERRIISLKESSWIMVILDKPIENKLDHLTAEPSEGNGEKFSQLLQVNGKPIFEKDSNLKTIIHMIIEELARIQKSDDSLSRTKDAMERLF
ncbi:hypothetical protein PSTG_02151 [Puccinia striiformis f. sp. tritici PST-78]|uniref:Uncharacterized protein n=1 Tax=Puccinia striiformis f. sp. tritici PST-78 TaxID=1165861 RepID=A0A0L0VZG1_9BASI|nr:hypothetical protein PSTG_02151 [Puccinia striiformis f. sp. tritici PST-78]